ncbi:hypothetical protein Bca4012_025489 [Brassica carinata]
MGQVSWGKKVMLVGGKTDPSSDRVSGGCNSCIVVMAGRWIMYDTGAWDFKIDNDRMGRAIDLSKIRGVEGLKGSIFAEYGLLGREVSVEMRYWLNDGESDMVGTGAAPGEIVTDTDLRIFKALHRGDKSVNLFVTFRERVAGEMIFLRSERAIMSPMNAPLGAPEQDDVDWVQEVEAIEALYKSKSLVGLIIESQSSGGANPESQFRPNKESCEQEKDNVCGNEVGVVNGGNNEGAKNGLNKEGNLPQQMCSEEETEGHVLRRQWTKVKLRWTVEQAGRCYVEDEGDDYDYDYNQWDDYIRDSCGYKDDDDDFEEGPSTGKHGGQFGGNGIRRSGGIRGRGVGTGKRGSGRGKRCSSGGRKSDKSTSKPTLSTDTIDVGNDYISSSRCGFSSYTQATHIDECDVIVHVTPTKTKNRDTRVTEDDDTPVSNRTHTEGVEPVDSGDVVLDTPPKEFNRHNREIEDDDDVFTDPPRAATTQTKGGEAFMKGISVSDMYGYNDVDGGYRERDETSCQPLQIDFSKEDSNIYVGRTFKDKAECKLTLAVYAIAKVCTFKLRHCKRRITAKCYDAECKWRVLAVQLGESPTYLVRKSILTHTCVSDLRGKYRKHGTAKVLAALLRSKYERLYSGPRAMELPEILRTEFNYTCSYWKGWRAKELAIASAQGTEETSYKMLPQYFHVLKVANPGTITDIKTELDIEGKSRFKYAFMSLKACIDGWKHLRKVIVVDGTHMFGKYKGCLLTASGQDANSHRFPIAFAVVESENKESWSWFFERLSTIVEDGCDLSMISDRCAAIFAAKEKWYPRAHHGICLVHLQRNVAEKYKGKQQKALVGRAGESFKVSEFNEIMELIKLTDWRCWDYLEKIDKKLWTRSHFKGDRFNMMTSNAAESLNKALLPARDSPIMALFEFIRRKLCTWFETRRCDISKMKGNIPDKIEEILVEQLVLSPGLLVLPCSTWKFEVSHKAIGFSFTVDLENRTCTCLEFQMLGLPCRHAIAAASSRNMEYNMYVSKHHLKETWAAAVEGIILPVQDPKDIEVPAEILKVDLCPPMTKRTKGRPGIKRKLSAGEVPVRLQLRL